jgi:hypothetical protein
MTFARKALMGVTALIFTGAPLLAQVAQTYDPSEQFNKVKTYGWAKVETTDPLLEPRLTIALDRVLQGYGWHLVDKNPDVKISAVDAAKNSGEYARFYRSLAGYPWRRGWGGGGFADGLTAPGKIVVGTLVVDIYRTSDHKLIWRGTAAQPEGSQKKMEDAIDKSVNSMFNKFPPKTGKGGAPNQNSVPDSASSLPTSN